MHFRVTHETTYRYDLPVALGPHLVRLSPRLDGVRIASERLDIAPRPVARNAETDAYSNRVVRLAFAGTTTTFSVTSTFDLVTDGAAALAEEAEPLPWAAGMSAGFDAYRRVSAGQAVRDYAHAIAAQAGQRPVAFLDRLAADIATRTTLGIRPDGHARSAEDTLTLREGACRDVTVLFLAASRALGLPGRFVSGYQARPAVEDGRRHLHAWAEVFLPGAGWRGWDVTHGTRVTDGHVALCAAPDQAGTMPIEGGFSFSGTGAASSLDYGIAIAAD